MSRAMFGESKNRPKTGGSNRDRKTVTPQNHWQRGTDGGFIIYEQKALSSEIPLLRRWNVGLLSHLGTVTLYDLANDP